jgi:hypothetical protein
VNEQIGLPSDDGARDINLVDGDVRTIRVLHEQDETHLLIFDDDDGLVPLVCAVVSEEERRALIRVLAGTQ